MKYFIAIIACLAQLLFLGLLWEITGLTASKTNELGFAVVIFAIWAATWRVITNRVKVRPSSLTDGKQYLRDILQEKHGGEWHEIQLPSADYGGGWCELGCGRNIGMKYSCYELKEGANLKGLLCLECWTNARK